MIYRKIGGIHWFSIGRVRIAFCLSQQGAQRPLTPRHRPKRQPAKPALTQASHGYNDGDQVDMILRDGIRDIVQRYSVHSPF